MNGKAARAIRKFAAARLVREAPNRYGDRNQVRELSQSETRAVKRGYRATPHATRGEMRRMMERTVANTKKPAPGKPNPISKRSIRRFRKRLRYQNERRGHVSPTWPKVGKEIV